MYQDNFQNNACCLSFMYRKLHAFNSILMFY